MAGKRVRKQLGSRRVDVDLKSKQEFCRMISFGQPFKEVQKAYMKKFKKQLSRTTFNRWKTDADAILAAGKKPGASRHSYKLAGIKLQLEEKNEDSGDEIDLEEIDDEVMEQDPVEEGVQEAEEAPVERVAALRQVPDSDNKVQSSILSFFGKKK